MEVSNASGEKLLNRLLVALLIPFLAFGNAFPHTHGAEFASADHSERPHIHWESSSHGTHHHGHHHHHDEGSQHDLEQEIDDQLPVDHDSDAVYLGAGYPFLPAPLGRSVDSEIDCVVFCTAVASCSAVPPRHRVACSDPPHRTGPPLFLLHAALRL